jgi:hypothetical protein
MAGIAIRFWNFAPVSLNKKLLPHFSEARAAVFAVQKAAVFAVQKVE